MAGLSPEPVVPSQPPPPSAPEAVGMAERRSSPDLLTPKELFAKKNEFRQVRANVWDTWCVLHEARGMSDIEGTEFYQKHRDEIAPALERYFQQQDPVSKNEAMQEVLETIIGLENPELAQIELSAVATNYFAPKRSAQARKQAYTVIKRVQAEGKSSLTRAELQKEAKQDINEGRFRTPTVFELLKIHGQMIDGEIMARSAVDEDFRYQYHQAWLEEQQKSRDIFETPSYAVAVDRFMEWEEGNGNRYIARGAIYGPPGTGKTKLAIRANEIQGYQTMVVSGRPYLGYEELVAQPELIPDASRNTATRIELARLYQDSDPIAVARQLYKVAKSVADKNIVVPEGEEAAEKLAHIENQKKDVAKAWLSHLELKDESVSWLMDQGESLSLSVASPQDEAKTAAAKVVRQDFVDWLTTEPLSSLHADEKKQIQFLEGLLIIADKAGMRVVIDEAEKIAIPGVSKGGEGVLVGLEDFLIKRPGETVVIGNQQHRIGSGFRVDITMNVPTLPKHIRSRFNSLVIELDPNPDDLLGIATVDIAQQASHLMAEDKEDLVVTLRWVWKTLEEEFREMGLPWDIRTLRNAFLSRLKRGEEGKPTPVISALKDTLVAAHPELLTQTDSPIYQFLAKFDIFSRRETSDLCMDLEFGPAESVPVESEAEVEDMDLLQVYADLPKRRPVLTQNDGQPYAT